jgi:hippurate hydrolase
VDPIVAASELVLALQTIVTREIDPTHAAVVSVGRFAAGTAPNVIAASARVEGTLRAQRPDVRATLREAVTRIAHGVARTHRVEATVHVIDSTPPVINHPDATRLAREAARTVVGEQGLQPMLNGNMGGEDFGFYAEQIPACFVRIGARPAGESYPAHSSRFDWYERALAYGAAYLHRVALVAGAELAGRE